MSRLENDILGNLSDQEALDTMITRSTDALLKRKNKKRLILDVDSTEDPAHGNQELMAYNGYFGKNRFHPLFCFSGFVREENVPSLGTLMRPEFW